VEFSKNGGKTVDRSIDSSWKLLIFLNGICEAEKSERSWDNFTWELREFSGKIEENIII
jgi:hypothetical protein